MRHPFDGVIGGEGEGLTRRGALGHIAAAAAGALGLVSAASAQEISTKAIGEEGGPPVKTTAAIGEEGAGLTTKALREEGAAGMVTTEPFGEEAGKVTSRFTPGMEDGGAGGPSTERVGEEGGPATAAVGEDGGPVATTLAIGEEGGPSTRALGEEGGRPPGRIIPVKPNTTDLGDKQLEAVWADLASKDAAQGVQGCAVLYGDKKAVKFLGGKLTTDKVKMPETDPKKIAALIADLDSDDFSTRENATKALEQFGPAATALLEKAVADAKSAEQRMRLERLLQKSKDATALNQAKRGLEVLVALKTTEAKELLEKLAGGPEKEWLTQAAKQAFDRASK